jgi:hypothetical protein
MVDTRNSHLHFYDTIKVVVRVEQYRYFQQKFIMSKTLIFTALL